MRAGPFDDISQDARLDENDPVWRLLGHAAPPTPDGWFTAGTLARCRREKAAGNFISSLWRWALGGGLAGSLAVALVISQIQSEKIDKQKNVQEAFEIMASINSDSDSSSSSSWQDTSL